MATRAVLRTATNTETVNLKITTGMLSPVEVDVHLLVLRLLLRLAHREPAALLALDRQVHQASIVGVLVGGRLHRGLLLGESGRGERLLRHAGSLIIHCRLEGPEVVGRLRLSALVEGRLHGHLLLLLLLHLLHPHLLILLLHLVLRLLELVGLGLETLRGLCLHGLLRGLRDHVHKVLEILRLLV